MTNTNQTAALAIADMTMPDLGIHVPMREYLERTVASAFRRQPDMSGDQRKRLLPHELQTVETAVEGLLQAAAAILAKHLTAPVSDGLDKKIARTIGENGNIGCWRSCTGCHETNEGVETGYYPYSDAFQCYLGGGCRECGGIGAVWDGCDYSDYAKFCQEEDTKDTRIAQLEAENSMFAAGVCIYPNGGGLLGDEHGNSFCSVEQDRVKLDHENTELMAKINELEARIEKLTRERDNATFAAMDFDLNRYMIASKRSGAEKAERHRDLTKMFLRVYAPKWRQRDSSLYTKIHDATQEVTNHLDRIGLEPDGHYDDEAPRRFHDEFVRLARAALNEKD